MRASKICTTLQKSCALEADASPTVSSFISPRLALKCRQDPNQTVIGKLYWAQAQFRCPLVVVHASAWGALWCKKEKSRSVRRIAISKDAWATAMRLCISPRLLSWQPVLWPDSFARRQILASTLPALRSDALKKNRGRQDPCRSWKVSRPACAVVFSLSTKTI